MLSDNIDTISVVFCVEVKILDFKPLQCLGASCIVYYYYYYYYYYLIDSASHSDLGLYILKKNKKKKKSRTLKDLDYKICRSIINMYTLL